MSAEQEQVGAHTPTPFGRLPYHRSLTRGRLDGGSLLRGIASDDGLNVAWVTLGVPGAEERLDAIVRSVNSHEAMREALEEIRTICTESVGETRKRMGTKVGNCLVVAERALALAKGK